MTPAAPEAFYMSGLTARTFTDEVLHKVSRFQDIKIRQGCVEGETDEPALERTVLHQWMCLA